MDFIERIFGISPDAGSGLTELALMIVPVVCIATFAMRRRVRSFLKMINTK
jgi:hypothetical protein